MIYAGPLLHDFMKANPAERSPNNDITVSWDWLNRLVNAAANKQLVSDVTILEDMVRAAELTAQELDKHNFHRLVDKALLEKFVLCAAIARLKQ